MLKVLLDKLKKFIEFVIFLLKILLLWYMATCWPIILIGAWIIISSSYLWKIIVCLYVFPVVIYLGKCCILFLRRPPGKIKWSIDGPITGQKYIIRKFVKGEEKKIAEKIAQEYNQKINAYDDELGISLNKLNQNIWYFITGFPKWCLNQSDKEVEKYLTPKYN
jgi:hypothetical protein